MVWPPAPRITSHGLTVRLLISVLLFSACVTLILTVVQLYLEYRNEVSALELRLDQISKTIAHDIRNQYAIGRAEPVMIEAFDDHGKNLTKVVTDNFDFKPRRLKSRRLQRLSDRMHKASAPELFG